MPSVVDRVAARHLQRAVLERGVAARYLMAAFIPDKLFKDYEKTFKQLLKHPIKQPVEDVTWLIHDRVIPLFERFQKDLIALAPLARETIEYRVGVNVDILKALASSYSQVEKALWWPYPAVSVVDHTLRQISLEVTDKLRKAVPTLGKALKVQPTVDAVKVAELARKAAKKASPEVIKAILDEDTWSGVTWKTKYDFFGVHVDKAALRLLKTTKVEKDFAGWFGFMRDVLEANYVNAEPRFSEFEINGMKIVVDDATVDGEQQAKYVKYLDAAYHLLKKKNLGRAWYGTVYIECESCGGVNPNTGGGTGGHFNIHKDHVKIFSRPSKFIIELMVHELGHRYWFKSMSSGQRAKFEAHVRAHKSPRPQGIVPRIIDPSTLKTTKQNIDDLEGTVNAFLQMFLEARVTKGYRELLDRFEDKLSKAGWNYGEVSTLMLREVSPEDPESKQLYTDARKSVDDVGAKLGDSNHIRKVLDYDVISLPDGTNYDKAFEQARAKFVEEAKFLVSTATANAYIYMDRSLQLHNEREIAKMTDAQRARQKEWDEDERQILPVTDYGKSNIDEAFAEVFAYYVLGWWMNADQEASFKAVLLNKDRTASKVAERWLTLAV